MLPARPAGSRAAPGRWAVAGPRPALRSGSACRLGRGRRRCGGDGRLQASSACLTFSARQLSATLRMPTSGWYRAWGGWWSGVDGAEVALRLLQTLDRADFVEALVDLVAGQEPLRGQLPVKVGQVIWLAGWHALDGGGAQQARAIIDVAHVPARPALIVAKHTSVGVNDVASIPAAPVEEDGHHRRLPATQEMLQRGVVIEIEVGIAVERPTQ